MTRHIEACQDTSPENQKTRGERGGRERPRINQTQQLRAPPAEFPHQTGGTEQDTGTRERTQSASRHENEGSQTRRRTINARDNGAKDKRKEHTVINPRRHEDEGSRTRRRTSGAKNKREEDKRKEHTVINLTNQYRQDAQNLCVASAGRKKWRTVLQTRKDGATPSRERDSHAVLQTRKDGATPSGGRDSHAYASRRCVTSRWMWYG